MSLIVDLKFNLKFEEVSKNNRLPLPIPMHSNFAALGRGSSCKPAIIGFVPMFLGLFKAHSAPLRGTSIACDSGKFWH